MMYAILAVVLIVIMWVISTYNFFVSTKTRVGAAIQRNWKTN